MFIKKHSFTIIDYNLTAKLYQTLYYFIKEYWNCYLTYQWIVILILLQLGAAITIQFWFMSWRLLLLVVYSKLRRILLLGLYILRWSILVIQWLVHFPVIVAVVRFYRHQHLHITIIKTKMHQHRVRRTSSYQIGSICINMYLQYIWKYY